MCAKFFILWKMFHWTVAPWLLGSRPPPFAPRWPWISHFLPMSWESHWLPSHESGLEQVTKRCVLNK